MNRTSKLMTAVTASLCLAGTLPVHSAVVLPSGQNATQPDESWKTDPQVQNAADTILAWMHEGSCKDRDMMTHTQDDVVKKFPQFDPTLVQQALKKLVYSGLIHQKGDGSKDNPFEYIACGSGSD
jgi:hypothetical protein